MPASSPAKTENEQQPGVRLTLVVTLRNGAQIRAGVKNVEIGRNIVTGELKTLNWTLDDDPFGNSIGWIDVGEVVAIHYEREPTV